MSELEETFHGQLRYAELLDGLVREHRFAKEIGRQWRFDFAWPEHKIAVELQGGIFRYDPSHTSVARMKGEMEKLNAAALMGWRVFTFHTDDVDDGIALNQVEQALREDDAA